MSEPKAN